MNKVTQSIIQEKVLKTNCYAHVFYFFENGKLQDVGDVECEGKLIIYTNTPKRLSIGDLEKIFMPESSYFQPYSFYTFKYWTSIVDYGGDEYVSTVSLNNTTDEHGNITFYINILYVLTEDNIVRQLNHEITNSDFAENAYKIYKVF